MSWDIYGEKLRPGHCEVHPSVHEEYPCSVCLKETQRRQEKSEHHFLKRELEAERDKNRRLVEAGNALTKADVWGRAAAYEGWKKALAENGGDR